jgi:hypothetical protein
MTDHLRKEILAKLQEMERHIETLTFTDLRAKAEEVFDRALLGEFLEDRIARKTAILKKVEQAITEQEPTAETKSEVPAPEPEKKVEAKRADEANPFPMNPEIKVLGHPDGPPMPTGEHDSPVEEVEVKAQPQEKAFPAEAPKQSSIAERAQHANTQTSLHQRLASNKLSFGLNDRLAYVKHLFDGSTEDFNRVVSQLNTFSNWDEASDFIETMLKPDYNWEEKPEYEERFVTQVKVKFEQA